MKKVSGWIKFLIFALVLMLSLVVADKVLCFKEAHGFRQARDMYAQPKDTIDVAFLGSSHIHVNINTALLWEEYGIASYDYSGAEQPMWMTYYYLKELCKYQSPKVVVLDFYSPAKFRDDYQYDYIADNFYGMRPSINKLQMLMASVEPSRIADFFPPLVSYHFRYRELEKEDFDYLLETKYDRQAFKGYTPYFLVEKYEKPDFSAEEQSPITEKSQLYLEKIVEFCKERDIQLFFIVTPYNKAYDADMNFAYIQKLAESYGVLFEDGHDFIDHIGINYATDLNDDSHLNYSGSCKYTRHLGAAMKAVFDIPDRRGDVRWESWDRNVAAIQKMVQQNGW